MKITILALAICCFCTLNLRAQNNYTVKGTAADTSSNTRLLNATVSVLSAKDSVLNAFTRADKNGDFAIGKLGKGKFILLLTYPGYADYVEHFTLDSSKNSHDFGKISMILKSKLLADVIVKGTRAAIKIKGDTTEFNADAFKIQPNAKVEDLLKELPGIQVDKDGKITAQGQTVNKVLVDGEEFFGDDPTLVTKNIRADMVDKVQVFDKKSDQSTFTGIDDGKKDKTINIKLKQDKKNGYFGKVDVGGGTDGYYSGQGLFNMFKAKQKFSAYATLGNTGKTGLGWQDAQKYGSSDALQFGDNGEIFIFGGTNDGLDSFSGQYDGQGIPLARTGGMHYDTKWDGDKQSLNTNYKIGSLQVDGTNNTLTQNNTPDGAINGTSNQNFHNFMFRQKLDGTYQIKLDTTQTLKISVDGTLKNTQTKTSYITSSTGTEGFLLNDNNRNVINNTDAKIFNASAFYTKKFRKKGRTFSLMFSEALNQSNSKGYLRSNARFYDTVGHIDSTQLIDQYKTNDLKSSILKANAAYTEPISKTMAVIFNYGVGVTRGTSNTKSFNQSAPGVYNVLVDSLSNDFRLNEFSNQVGAIFNYKKNKTIINFGTKVSNVNFNQINEYTGDILKRDFVNWNPQASLQYRFSQQQSVYLGYNGNTTQPTINQIQPVIVNTDPLNIVLGNPFLRPSFTNSIFANFNSYKVLSGQSIWLNGNYSFVTNPIVSSLITDASNGKTTSQYINLAGKVQSNYNFNAYLDRKIAAGDFNVGLNAQINGNQSYNLSDGDVNLTRSTTFTGQLRFSKYKQKKYDFNFEFGPNYTISGSSLQRNINNNGRGFSMDGGFTIYLPGKFQVASDANYDYKAPTQTFNTDYRKTILNASIAKTFFKEDNLKLLLSGNDLLNQNIGFSRTNANNYIVQNTYTTIRRYFMVSLVYDFNKVGGGAPKK